jgi:hypothetical protein
MIFSFPAQTKLREIEKLHSSDLLLPNHQTIMTIASDKDTCNQYNLEESATCFSKRLDEMDHPMKEDDIPKI